MKADLGLRWLRGRRGALLVVASATLFATLLSGSAAAADRWKDVSDAEWVSRYGVSADQVGTIAAGFTDGAFRPGLPVSQAHFAKMASAAGISLDEADGAASPAAPVTRQQACSVLGLFLSQAESVAAGHIAGERGEYISLAAWYAAEGTEVLAPFIDSDGVSPDSAAATAYLVHCDVVQGSSRAGALYLDPSTSLTRAQAVVLILRVSSIELPPPRTVEPLVTTQWLQENLATEGLVVIDLRSAADYGAAHIPGSISVPFSSDSAWAGPTDLVLELPPQDDLFGTIGACGIARDSSVVLVGGVTQTTPAYPLIDAARVAATLIHSGVRNVGILEGGHARWAAEGRGTTTDVPPVVPVDYDGPAHGDVFVSTDYVEEHLGAATIVDTRSAEIYFGMALDAAAPKPGHIAAAVSLPTQWTWQADGAYLSAATLRAMATGVIGPDKSREVIVYCTYGGTASVWWFMLSQVLGYRDVKLYDGSAQAWVRDHDMVAFDWGG